MIELLQDVTLEPIQHIYTDETGTEFGSVSSILKMLKEPFDAKTMSWMVARKQLREQMSPNWKKGDPEPTQEAIDTRQQVILKEWKDIGDESRDHGTEVHEAIEAILLVEPYDDEKFAGLDKLIKVEYGHYHQIIPELTVYNRAYNKAGTIDNVAVRQNSKNSLVDLSDYKTNVRNGMQYDSTKLQKNGKLKHYNRMLLPPVDHLEQCNYIITSLQLSFYAFFFEELYKMKIGRLSTKYIYEIGGVWQLQDIPMAYLKSDVIKILNVLYQEENIGYTDPDDY